MKLILVCNHRIIHIDSRQKQYNMDDAIKSVSKIFLLVVAHIEEIPLRMVRIAG